MHAGEHAGLESAQPSELHTSCVQYYHVLLVNVTRTTVYKHTSNNDDGASLSRVAAAYSSPAGPGPHAAR